MQSGRTHTLTQMLPEISEGVQLGSIRRLQIGAELNTENMQAVRFWGNIKV